MFPSCAPGTLKSGRRPRPRASCSRQQNPELLEGGADLRIDLVEVLQNAASIASLLLTTEAVISQIPEEHKHAAVPGGGMGGGMY